MQHYSKRSSFAEKVIFSKKKKKKERKKERKKKRDLTTSTSHSFSHCKRCSLRFSLPLQREKLPFGPLLASPRFSLQLQDFAAVSMETAALRVQKAKSCSRVTRALGCAQTATRMDGHATKRPCVYDRRAHTAVTTQHGRRFVLVFREFDDGSPSFQRFCIRSAVFKLVPHDPVGLRVLFRLVSQVKKVMTNWELETAVSSHNLNHALRFRHVHVRPANILRGRTRTVLRFPIFCF